MAIIEASYVGIDQEEGVPYYWSRAAGAWVAFGEAANIESVTSTPYTVSGDDSVLIVKTDTIGSAATVNLPAAASVKTGRTFTIKRSGSYAVVVDGNGSETIDGSTTQTLNSNNVSITIQSDGSGWWIL